MNNLPATVEDAILQNSKFYFSGIPCCRGHVCNRRTSTKKCVLCAKEIGLKYISSNTEQVKLYHIANKKNNPQQYLLAGARARAKKTNLPCTIKIEDIIIPEFCPILNIKLEINTSGYKDNSPSLDKIIPKLGYVPGNVMVISMRANMIKNNATIEELGKIYNYLLSMK